MTSPSPAPAPRLTRRQFTTAALSSAAYMATHTCLRGQVAAGNTTVRFETDALRLEISGDGIVRRVVAKHDNTEYGVGGPVATVYRGGRFEPGGQGVHAAVIGHWAYQGGGHFDATNVRREADRLQIEFAGANVRATYRVINTRDYVAFELLAVEGPAVDRIEFLQLRIRRLPMLGEWVNLAYDDRFGLCLCGGSLQTDIRMEPHERDVRMVAAAEATVGFSGATAVLFGCREPKKTFLDTMAVVERDFRLPAGAAFRRSPDQRLSYLWAGRPDPQNIAEYIRWAKIGGFRLILFSYRAFSKGAGHFEFNRSYPNGFADLKRVTDAIRAAGLKIGLHLHYSKVDRTDAYVTPVPDDRLHTARSFTLAADLSAEADTVRVRESVAGCTLDQDRRILKIGKELIEYQSYSEQEPFLFTGCRRGHLGTKAVSHAVASRCHLLDFDTWPLFVRIAQNSDLQDEIAKRIAEIYHRTGPYDMVYFDGAEDVHEPFWYHTASAQQRVFQLLNPPPAVCEAAHYTHFSWHMISRANAYDNVAAVDGMKDFCRLMPSRTAGARALDFSRIDFGWVGRFGASKLGTAGPDIYEYIASRAAGWDCPISLHATVEDFRSNPRAEDCLAAIRIWEDARLGHHLTEANRRLLRNVSPEDACYVSCYEQRDTYENIRTNRNLSAAQRRILADRCEHHLFINEKGNHELVEIEEVAGVADGLLKAFLFRREGNPRDTFALVWAMDGEVHWQVATRRLTAMRPFGTGLRVEQNGDTARLVVGPRTYVGFADTTTEQAKQLLRATRASR